MPQVYLKHVASIDEIVISCEDVGMAHQSHSMYTRRDSAQKWGCLSAITVDSMTLVYSRGFCMNS